MYLIFAQNRGEKNVFSGALVGAAAGGAAGFVIGGIVLIARWLARRHEQSAGKKANDVGDRIGRDHDRPRHRGRQDRGKL